MKNWQDKIEKDLAFPTGKEFKYGDEDSAYAYRFRKLVADRDITFSLDKIKEMRGDGTLKRALDDQDINMVFANLLEKGREDVADYLYMIGYKVTDLNKTNDHARRAYLLTGKLSCFLSDFVISLVF